MVWQGIRIIIPGTQPHPLYAYISVVLAMRDTPENTITYGKTRIKTTIIGLSVALFFISISQRKGIVSNIYVENAIELAIIVIGTTFSIYLAYILKCNNLCAISAAVFLVCIIYHNSEGRYVYALLRTLETVLGIAISIMVNKYFFMPRKAIEEELVAKEK